MEQGKSFLRKLASTTNLLLWLVFLFFLAVSYTSATRYFVKPLAVTGGVRSADCIVVLGGGVDEGGFLTPISSQRLLRGIEIYYEGRAKNILFSGGTSGPDGVAEATVMARAARRLNVPSHAILVEGVSMRTAEEATEIKKMAEARKWKSILLVTSYIHMKRSVMVFEHAGFKVYPAPADPYELHVNTPLRRFALFFQLMHEYGGIVYYKFRGWI
jgi:uncharacterized SAM-binding protein YcdF (DUF218 family)